MANFIWWRGGRFNSGALPSLLMAEKKAKLPIRVMQGGFNAGGVAASAGTHDGGDVVDMSVSGWSQAQIRLMLLWLRRCGWAAWYRTRAQGFSPHIHAVRIGGATASRGAKAQVYDYKMRRNGLVGGRADDGPYVPYTSWAKSSYNPANGAPVSSGGGGSVPSKKKLRINGKDYPEIASVSVYYINEGRGKKHMSRHTAILQMWLSEKEANTYHDKVDGVFGPKTQKALDDYRRKFMNLRGTAAGGKIGIGSLTHIRNRVGSKRKVRVGK